MVTDAKAPEASGIGLAGSLAVSSLVHGYDDVRPTYGDNPNGLSDEERLIARALASNTASLPGGGSAF
jgi:hypothetical protein